MPKQEVKFLLNGQHPEVHPAVPEFIIFPARPQFSVTEETLKSSIHICSWKLCQCLSLLHSCQWDFLNPLTDRLLCCVVRLWRRTLWPFWLISQPWLPQQIPKQSGMHLVHSHSTWQQHSTHHLWTGCCISSKLQLRCFGGKSKNTQITWFSVWSR